MSQVNGSEFVSNITICLLFKLLFWTGLIPWLEKITVLNIIIMRMPLLKCLHKPSVNNGEDWRKIWSLLFLRYFDSLQIFYAGSIILKLCSVVWTLLQKLRQLVDCKSFYLVNKLPLKVLLDIIYFSSFMIRPNSNRNTAALCVTVGRTSLDKESLEG